MFEAHFGFRENPFKLDHNLSYLFWGRHQEEVIAHLHYAVMEGEGFIAITGELGVGKTVVCRSFIQNLGPDVTAAYIDNPVGSSEKLLRRLNEQFGIRCGALNAIALMDALNTFLMQTKPAGKKVTVFIDDAQLLQKDTLEQVRLISNLETSRDKLIQIVLVGEPELTEMLASYDLRQIGQRVSVKYHIGPFNLAETIAYIQHRLAIASKVPAAPFDQRAYRHIFRFSGGNPRAINIACNRALTTAFHRKETRITGELAEEVVGHLTGRGEKTKLEYFRRRRIGWMAAGSGILLASITAAYFLQPNRFEASQGQTKPQQHETAELSVPKTTEAPVKMASTDKAATRAAEEKSLPRETLPLMESPKRPAMEPSPVRQTPPPGNDPLGAGRCFS